MPFEDVGVTKRKSMSRGRILRIWEQHKGICVLCSQPIDGAKSTWFVEHIVALELGGKDTDDNCGPAHYACKPAKDREDHKRAAAARQDKADHLGIPVRSKLKSRGFAPPKEKRRPATAPLNKILPRRRPLYGEA